MELRYWKKGRLLVENDFRITNINAKERVTFQNEGNSELDLNKGQLNLLRQRNKVKRIIRNGHFVRASFLESTKGVKRRKLATSRALHCFHCNWRMSILIK